MRPSLAGPQRPSSLPGRVPGGSIENRPAVKLPGAGGNRPGIGGDRPEFGGNRPGIGDDNNFWNSGFIGSGNWGNNNSITAVNVGGRWGLPGYSGWGYGGWVDRWNSGYVNPHYGGWYNGCWGGNWGYNGGWWAPFAVGAATWGLVSTIGDWGWGYGGGYVNPYVSSIPTAVVAASPYDYSQPVMVNNYVTNDAELTDASTAEGGAATSEQAPSTTEADRLFDAALASFKAGDYESALDGCDRAVKLSANDSVIHEVRALALFALGRYTEAAAALNAVLAVAPGMDWTTMSGLYGSVDDYTQQLRKLEELCRSNSDSAAGYFVLAYHYLVGGHVEMAADALRVVTEKQPSDAVAKRLLDAIDPPIRDEADGIDSAEAKGRSGSSAGETPSGPETDLVGAWLAKSGQDEVELSITEDFRFTWKAAAVDRPAVEISGTIQTARDAIALVSETAGTISGKVISKGADAFEFSLDGAPTEAKPITFERRKE